MSLIASIGRSLMAVCQPLTGSRATGVVTIATTAGDYALPCGTWLWPVINGQAVTSMNYRVGPGPEADGSWVITPAGVDVNVFSNIGGDRHNVDTGTPFVFTPPSGVIASAAANGAFVGGTNASGFGSLRDIVAFDNTVTPGDGLDLNRSQLRRFPGMVVTWMGSEPADGSTASQAMQRMRTNRNTALYREIYLLSIIVERHEAVDHREEEGLYLLDVVSNYLCDRHSVDDFHFSNPSGVQIMRRWRVPIDTTRHKRTAVFNLQVGVMAAIQGRDDRVFSPWELSRIDVLIRPDQNDDNLLIDDMDVDMTP